MDLIGKLPTVAATIYRNLYRDGTSIGAIDTKKDWSANFTSMLGYENAEFTELIRLYLTIHRLSHKFVKLTTPKLLTFVLGRQAGRLASLRVQLECCISVLVTNCFFLTSP